MTALIVFAIATMEVGIHLAAVFGCVSQLPKQSHYDII